MDGLSGPAVREAEEERDAQDWDRANVWKIPSLVVTSLNAEPRPIEVERDKTYWADIPNCVLRIPINESSKSSSPMTT